MQDTTSVATERVKVKWPVRKDRGDEWAAIMAVPIWQGGACRGVLRQSIIHVAKNQHAMLHFGIILSRYRAPAFVIGLVPRTRRPGRTVPMRQRVFLRLAAHATTLGLHFRLHVLQ